MRAFLIVLFLCLSALPARAAELVMFESDGCYWCDRWKEEVGRYYYKTREARIAPLRMVNLRDPRPAHLQGIRGVAMTPTFVVIDQGREMGRIIGYPGEQAFWVRLTRILAQQQYSGR